MKRIVTLVFACILAASSLAHAKETKIFLNPDKPVYTAGDGILSVELPSGQWNTAILESGAFRARDGSDGDTEYTEIHVASFPRKGIRFKTQVETTLKGYADTLMLNTHPEQEWFETILNSQNQHYVYIREVFLNETVYRLMITCPMSQKPSFDYAVKVTSQSFRPLPQTR